MALALSRSFEALGVALAGVIEVRLVTRGRWTRRQLVLAHTGRFTAVQLAGRILILCIGLFELLLSDELAHQAVARVSRTNARV